MGEPSNLWLEVLNAQRVVQEDEPSVLVLLGDHSAGKRTLVTRLASHQNLSFESSSSVLIDFVPKVNLHNRQHILSSESTKVVCIHQSEPSPVLCKAIIPHLFSRGVTVSNYMRISFAICVDLSQPKSCIASLSRSDLLFIYQLNDSLLQMA